MLDAIAVTLAALALVTVLSLFARFLRLEQRLESCVRTLGPGGRSLPDASGPPSPLAGLRITLAVKQDYAHPVFERLLQELLLVEDVAEIISMTLPEADELRLDWQDGPELLIAGELVGNGYAEVYYNADFTCYASGHAICTLVERPPNGDRPSNLALELVMRVKASLEKHVIRDARRKAIRELKFDAD